MNPGRRRWRWWLGCVSRCVLGAFFVWMGAVKALDPAGFLKQVHAYGMLESRWWLNLTAAVLPWMEILCGLLLVVGRWVRGSALVVAVMLAGFSVALATRALALHAGGAVPFCSIRFDCGCGGGEVWICRKLVENAVLLAAALWWLLRTAPAGQAGGESLSQPVD